MAQYKEWYKTLRVSKSPVPTTVCGDCGRICLKSLGCIFCTKYEKVPRHHVPK
jgi:hypothetical protein